MILEHYSHNPPTVLRDVERQERERGPYGKPKGFWVSVKGEDDWPSWCESECYGQIEKAAMQRYELVDGHNVLLVGSSPQLLRFDAEYGADAEIGPSILSFRSIDWKRVADKYDGIIIAPYQWKHRLSLRWYYGWDCASGCVWRPSKAIRLVGREEEA